MTAINGRPRCAVCRKEVERVTIGGFDPLKRTLDVIVECHGAVEVAAIDERTVVGADRIGLDGEAFTTPLIASGRKA